MKQYSLAFIFDRPLERVLLIHKNRPSYQAGKLNGLGGKFESGEQGIDCVVREIKEEAGIDIPATDWQAVGTIGNTEWRVHVFTCIFDHPEQVVSVTDEQVEWVPITQESSPRMENLHWLIPLCKDMLLHHTIEKVEVAYTVMNTSV